MSVFPNHPMMEEVVVTGTLVKSSFERFAQWVKLLFLFQLVLFIYRILTNVHDSSEPFLWVCTFVAFGIWVPLCGYSSATARERTCLSLFSWMQFVLSLWGVFRVWDYAMHLSNLKDGCDYCAAVFDQGPETCRYAWDNNWIIISRNECKQIPSTTEFACTTILMTLVSGTGCCAALAARQMLNENHVVAQIMETVPEIEVGQDADVPEAADDPTHTTGAEPYRIVAEGVVLTEGVEEKSSEVV